MAVFISFLVFVGALALLLWVGFSLFRSRWVYLRRMEILDADMGVFERLPTYEYMLRKWWIWDMSKFINGATDADIIERRRMSRAARGRLAIQRAKEALGND